MVVIKSAESTQFAQNSRVVFTNDWATGVGLPGAYRLITGGKEDPESYSSRTFRRVNSGDRAFV